MFERFTDRAKKVMQLANLEAHRFNHEYIGTEHILLGLVIEGQGVAAHVLKNLDVDLHRICIEVMKIIPRGHDPVTMTKVPLTPRAKKVIEYAMEEARGFEHNYVGTEHMLLGVLRETEGVGAQVLINMGLELREVRQEIVTLLGEPVREPADARVSSQVTHFRELGSMEYTERARKVMLLAAEEVYNFGHTYLGPEHILLGICREGTSVGVKVLQTEGLSESRVRDEIEVLLRGGAELKGQHFQLTSAAFDGILLASSIATLCDAERVDSDHLLLGLLKESETLSRDRERIIAELFRNLGADRAELFGKIRHRLEVSLG